MEKIRGYLTEVEQSKKGTKGREDHEYNLNLWGLGVIGYLRRVLIVGNLVRFRTSCVDLDSAA